MKIKRHFGGTCRLDLGRRRIIQARNQHEAGSKHTSALWRHVPPKRRMTFNGQRDFTSKKTELHITAAVRTSNLTERKKLGTKEEIR
jgi:hypothetical protein